jgi:hypothetical protein
MTCMAKGPENAPLGATPILPLPLGNAASRVSSTFRRYIDRVHARGEPTEPLHNAPFEESVQPPSSSACRRYDVARSKVASVAPSPLDDEPTPVLEAPGFLDKCDATQVQTNTTPTTRPPAFAATVRPAVRRGEGPAALPQETLEQAADSALLASHPDGSVSFDIVFNDEVFRDLACSVRVKDGRVVATFRARDKNLKRLLEAEAPRLRDQLEAKGLRVEEVRVEIE